MGNTSSTQNYVRNETNLSLAQRFVTNNLIQANSQSTNVQVIKIKIDTAIGCPINSSQTINSTQKLVTTLNNNSNVQFSSELTNSLQSTVTANASMVNGFAAATGGNSADVTNNVQNIIKEVVDQQLTNNNIMKTVQNSYNSQSQEVTMILCQNSPIIMDQNIISNVISENILTNVTQALMQNATISSLISYADQHASVHNQGLNDVIDSIGKALSSIIGAFTGPYALVAIGACVLCCVCCIALLYFMLSPAGQQSATTVSQAGANYAGRMPPPV